MKAKYINPYTDFGFKKLFGEEANIDLLKDFLNGLLPPEHQITELSFKNNEKIGAAFERKAIIDIHCRNAEGEYFIVEMQKAKLRFFKDRSVFYTTFPIREQAEKGDWNFKLNPIYCVGILDFVFDDHHNRNDNDCISNIQLKDQYCRIFYDKLTYIFIEMPLFKKEEHQLEEHFDKWLYFLKHLEDFTAIPDILKEDVFVKGFEVAEIANFTPEQMMAYEESLKVYRDLKGVIDTSFDEGEEKGIIKGKEQATVEIAKKLLGDGADIDMIIRATGLSRDKLDTLRRLS